VWKKEFEKFRALLPTEYQSHIGEIAIFETQNKKVFDNWDSKIILTTPSTLTNLDVEDCEIFKKKFDNLFLDEFHHYINSTTKIHKLLYTRITVDKKFLLSGTPLQEINSNIERGFENFIGIEFIREEEEKENEIVIKQKNLLKEKILKKFENCPFLSFYCKLSKKLVLKRNSKDVHNDDRLLLQKSMDYIANKQEELSALKISDVLNKFFITRDKKEEHTPFDINVKEIFFELKEEKVIYDFFKNIIINSVSTESTDTYQLFDLISIIRRTLIIPYIPFVKYIKNKIQLLKDEKELLKFNNEITSLIHSNGIKEWFEKSLKGQIIPTRVSEVLKIINTHPNEGIVIFSCFIECLSFLKIYLTDRKVFLFSSDLSIEKREEMIQEYISCEDLNPIFLTTYNMGSEGLNLQTKANVVIKIDMYWNVGKEHQAESRVNRKGQTSDRVYIYSIHSNTSFEKTLIELRESKESKKENILNKEEIKVRSSKFSVEKILDIL